MGYVYTYPFFFYIFGRSRAIIMLETIFAILAAVITIFIAGLLVKKQNEFHETTEKLNNTAKDKLEDIVNEVAVLIGEEPTEHSLGYLEKRMDMFNKTLNIVQKPTYKRRNKHVKRPKNPTDD